MLDNKSFCAAAYIHVCVDYDPRYRFRPCCTWDPHADYSGLQEGDDPLQTKFMQQMRADMTAGKPIQGCQRCYDREAVGSKSNRLRYNEAYGVPAEVKLLSLEYNLGNLCNMKCRMCNANSSSKWLVDHELFNQKPAGTLVRRSPDTLGFDYTSVRDIKFIGGEPTLEQEQIRKILLTIRADKGSLSHLRVEIATNGTARFDDDIMTMLHECRAVSMEVSMDGLGRINDYQRVGGDWQTIADNAAWYAAQPNSRFKTGILTTVTLLNIAHIPELMDWISTNIPRAWHEVIPLEFPEQLNACNLPDCYKQQLIKRYTDWVPASPKPNTEAMRRRMIAQLQKKPICTIAAVRKRLLLLDQVMQDSLWAEIPELAENIFID